MTATTDNKLMKDGLNKAALKRIANSLEAVYQSFDKQAFVKKAAKELEPLELRQRVDKTIEILGDYLPKNFFQTAFFLKMLPEYWDRGDEDDSLSGFAAWPIIDYVAINGIKSPKTSFEVLEKLTPLFSAEFAIRPFIEQHPEATIARLESWCTHPDEHVRRLVSEGTRPRLPWGKQLKQFVDNPEPILPLLEKLKNDESLYVRRSVANNLNDISKDHPDLVIKISERWKKEKSENIDWLIKHALRSLIKDGNPKVFPLLGFTRKPEVNIKKLQLDNKKIKLGDDLQFKLELDSSKKQKLVLDYAIHYVKASGDTKAKVFKWKNIDLKKGETQNLEKKQAFKPTTTRKLYPGKHYFAVHINGIEQCRKEFHLET